MVELRAILINVSNKNIFGNVGDMLVGSVDLSWLLKRCNNFKREIQYR